MTIDHALREQVEEALVVLASPMRATGRNPYLVPRGAGAALASLAAIGDGEVPRAFLPDETGRAAELLARARLLRSDHPGAGDADLMADDRWPRLREAANLLVVAMWTRDGALVDGA